MWSAIAADERVRYFSSSVSRVRRFRPDEDRLGDEQGHEGGEDERAGEQDEEADPRRPERPLTIATL